MNGIYRLKNNNVFCSSGVKIDPASQWQPKGDLYLSKTIRCNSMNSGWQGSWGYHLGWSQEGPGGSLEHIKRPNFMIFLCNFMMKDEFSQNIIKLHKYVMKFGQSQLPIITHNTVKQLILACKKL